MSHKPRDRTQPKTWKARTNPEGLCTRCGRSGFDEKEVSPCGYDELAREVWLCFECIDRVVALALAGRSEG